MSNYVVISKEHIAYIYVCVYVCLRERENLYYENIRRGIFPEQKFWAGNHNKYNLVQIKFWPC